MKWIGAVCGLIFGATAVQGAAMAACLQADVAGTWQAYSLGVGDGGSAWTICRLVVNPRGTAAPTFCTLSNGETVQATRGRLLLRNSANCTFTGEITLGDVPNRIRHATMSRDKNTVEGVGVVTGGIFRFTMTRI